MLGGMVKNGIGLGFIFHAIIPHDRQRGATPASHGHNSLLLPPLKV